MNHKFTPYQDRLYPIKTYTKYAIITLMISYQFHTLIPRIDPEFHCGSRGMVFK